MSFGIRSLKKKNQDNQSLSSDGQKRFVKNIIVGRDLSSLFLFSQLRAESRDCFIISEKNLSMQDFEKLYHQPLSYLRGGECAQSISECFQGYSLNLIKEEQEPLFYKDQVLKSFHGRSKPMLMLQGEELFTHPGYDLHLGHFFGENWSKLDEFLSSHMIVGKVFEIEMVSPSDLVNREHYKITLADDSVLFCENLYWGEHPQSFLKSCKDADDFDNSLHQFSYSARSFTCLQLNFTLNSCPWESVGNTVFIPQSQTHEWGHFVGRVNNSEEGPARASFVAIIREELQAEELAKKVRLMKRSIDRVYQDFQEVIGLEEILVEPDFFVQTDSEVASPKLPDHMHLIGRFDPQIEQCLNYDFLAKSLSSAQRAAHLS